MKEHLCFRIVSSAAIAAFTSAIILCQALDEKSPAKRRKRLPCERIIVKEHPKKWWEAGSYIPYDMQGFSLMLDPKLPADARLVMEEDLCKVREKLLTTGALKDVASACHIWVNHDNGHVGACAHWCEKEFEDPLGKVQPRGLSVEIHNWNHYNTFLLKREGVLLHELSHVYNGTLGFEYPPIVAMYDKAKQSKKYEDVAISNGTRGVAYGIQSHVEFFASLSVAFLGGENDYQPFDREDLMSFDPESFENLQQIWRCEA